MRPSYGQRPARAGGVTHVLLAPVRWLVRLHPLQSWLVVMAVILGLSMVGLRPLAWLVALAWLGYAAYTWFAPSVRRRFGRFSR